MLCLLVWYVYCYKIVIVGCLVVLLVGLWFWVWVLVSRIDSLVAVFTVMGVGGCVACADLLGVSV